MTRISFYFPQLLLAICLSGCSREENDSSRLVLEHNFGVIRPMDRVSHRFQIHNTTSVPYVLEGVSTTCSCTIVRPSKSTILSGETVGVDLEFDVGNIHGLKQSAAFLRFNEANVEIRVRAQVKDAMEAQPRNLMFSNSDPTKITIDNFSGDKWGDVRVVEAPAWIDVGRFQRKPAAVEGARGRWEAYAKADSQVNTKLIAETFMGAVRFQSDTGVESEIHVRLARRPNLIVTPASIVLSVDGSGSSLQKTLFFNFSNTINNSSMQGSVRFLSGDLLKLCDRRWEKTAGTRMKLSLGFEVREGAPRNRVIKDTLEVHFAEREVIQIPVSLMIASTN